MKQMKKVRKYAILAMFPLHLLLMHLFEHGTSSSDWFYIAVMLTVHIADMVLSFWQLELLTSKRNRVRELRSDFFPYLLEKLLLIAAEWGIVFWITKGNFGKMTAGFGDAIAAFTASVSMVLNGIVTFAIGAARTMLYHDEKR